jgi:hypothetical protein
MGSPFVKEKTMAETVKLEIEFGDIEVEFEGPADFARKDLVPLVSALVEKLASVEVGFDVDEDDEDDEDETEADEGAEAKPAGH